MKGYDTMRKKYEPINRLTDKRVKKCVVFDTETAPYYEKVEPYI